MPDLQKLYESLKSRGDVAFVLMQVREDFATSQRWAATRKLRLPFYDSGAGSGDPNLRTADGARIGDREIAISFPPPTFSTRHVVFRMAGDRWSEYRDFLLDAAKRSGK
jgi:hypothetical protein